jgi:thioredoxin 1
MRNRGMMKRMLAAVGVLIVIAVAASACSEGPPDPAGFEGGPGMLYFYSPKCPVCRNMTPIVDELEKQYHDDFKFVRVDVETNRGKERARAHGLIGQPAFLIFDSSDEEVRRLTGAHSRATLEQAIQQAMQGE